MDLLDPRIEEQLDGPTVRYADLVRFAFKSGEVRLWGGFGRTRDGNGEEWTGLVGPDGQAIGKMSSVKAGPGGAVEELTLSLFGSDAMLAKLRDDTEETVGREVSRYVQFFDVRQWNEAGLWVDWDPIAAPVQIFWGRMGAPYVDHPPTDVGGAASRVISVKALSAFLNRRKPSFGFFSHSTQQALTGGTDNGFIRASRMADATANWPVGMS